MKKLLSLALAAALCLSAAACGTAPAEPNTPDTPSEGKTYVVGICQFVQHAALDAATQGFKDALVEELGDAACVQSVARMPARVKCAELAWRTLGEMLDERAK